MGVLAVVLLSALSGVLYRIGGSGAFHHSKLVRRVGCVLCSLLALWAIMGLNKGIWWSYVLFALVSYGFITTYHDWTGKDNFFLHGLFLGLAGFALMPLGVHWQAVLLRSVVLGLAMGIWCLIFSDVTFEEVFRGSVIVATIPLLLI